jgi:hypothetical protein
VGVSTSRKQDRSVELSVVRHNEVEVLECGLQTRPHLAKRRRDDQIRPSQAVDASKAYRRARWSHAEAVALDDFALLNADESDGARAVAPPVRRFEVDGGESRHNPSLP